MIEMKLMKTFEQKADSLFEPSLEKAKEVIIWFIVCLIIVNLDQFTSSFGNKMEE